MIHKGAGLRSGANHLLVRHSHLKIGHHTFSLAEPHVWNASVTDVTTTVTTPHS